MNFFPMFRLLVQLLVAGFFGGRCIAGPIIIEKNLFSPARRPPPADLKWQKQDSIGNKSLNRLPPITLRLDGVFICDKQKRALVRVNYRILQAQKEKGKANSPYLIVGEGDSIGDFKVVKIDAKSISLQRDERVYKILLFADEKTAPPDASLMTPPVVPELPDEPRIPTSLVEEMKEALPKIPPPPTKRPPPPPGTLSLPEK